MPDESKPNLVASIELKDAIASAWVLLAGLLPNKALSVSVAALAPFVGRGLAWFIQEQAQEWLADRKASAPTRRAERYLGQMEKRAKKLTPSSPARLQLDQEIAQVAQAIHAHKMSELVVLTNGKPTDETKTA